MVSKMHKLCKKSNSELTKRHLVSYSIVKNRFVEDVRNAMVATILHINSETNPLPPSVMIEIESICIAYM